MNKRLQIILSDEALNIVNDTVKSANENYKNGRITSSDIINEMIINAKIDILTLQKKHLNVKKSLRNLATQKNPDIDAIIKELTLIKSKMNKKNEKEQQKTFEGVK